MGTDADLARMRMYGLGEECLVMLYGYRPREWT